MLLYKSLFKNNESGIGRSAQIGTKRIKKKMLTKYSVSDNIVRVAPPRKGCDTKRRIIDL